MLGRISTSSRMDLLKNDMNINLANYNRLTAQLAANSKILSITDDPIAAVNVVNTNRQLGNINTFSQNVGMASKELSALDDLMELAGGYLNTAWQKAVQANQQTYGHNSLAALKTEIDETIKTMVDLANTEYNDNYIFAGANTKIPPYEIDEAGNIIYKGTPHDNPDYIRQTEVADGVFETINTTGDKVFGYYKAETVTKDVDGNVVTKNEDGTYSYEDGTAYTGDVNDLKTEVVNEEYSGVMGALKVLSNSLQEVMDAQTAGDVEMEKAGYAKMNSTLDMFSNSLNTILTEQTKFGGVANRLEMTESTLETTNESLTGYLSQIKDIDYATAITDWLQAQYAYQASLQVSSSAMNMSLLNYMR